MFCFSIFIFSPSIINIFFFFFNDTPTTEIYTLSLHDALPISATDLVQHHQAAHRGEAHDRGDRKSTRLNSSHEWISYAVFCLKKKKDLELSVRREVDLGWGYVDYV